MTVSDAQKRATAKYKSNHMKRIPLDVQKDWYEQVRAFLDTFPDPETGKAPTRMNTYIRRALNNQLAQDGFVYKNPHDR